MARLDEMEAERDAALARVNELEEVGRWLENIGEMLQRTLHSMSE